jgi:hypothetical protein
MDQWWHSDEIQQIRRDYLRMDIDVVQDPPCPSWRKAAASF